MNKIVCIVLCFAIAGFAAGCGGSGEKSEGKLPSETASPSETTEGNTSEAAGENASSEGAEENASSETAEGEKSASGSAESDIDIDLTKMSSTMVYAQVYDMVTNPDEFLGKKVKCKGPFGVYTDEDGKNFYACIIRDATACCAQGMEFELKGEHKYPEDYPKQEEEITVIGTFDKYEDKGATYCTLRKAEIVES